MGKVLDNIDFFGSMLITVVVALAVTVLVLFFDSYAFAFAKYEFPGSKWLFGLLLATFMIPAQLSLVPQFVTRPSSAGSGR